MSNDADRPRRVRLRCLSSEVKASLDGRLTPSRRSRPPRVEKLFQEAEFERETKLWFLWAAAVLAILCIAHIPVKHPKRKQLLNGPIKVLEKLQSKLPLELQRRKTPNSLRAGLKKKLSDFRQL
jgi:hypothetical protein